MGMSSDHLHAVEERKTTSCSLLVISAWAAAIIALYAELAWFNRQMTPAGRTFLSASRRFFLVCVLTYVPMKKPTRLKKGTQVCSGRNFCAKARASGEVIQLTFMTGRKPALTVARTWWNVRAPAMMAIDER